MVVMRLLLACALCCLMSVSYAEESNAPATVPDPVNLEANWWSYFYVDDNVKKTELTDRIEKSQSRLKQSIKGLTEKQRVFLAAKITKINEDLTRYAKLRDASTIPEMTVPPTAEKYTVSEALERYQLWRKMKREQDLVQDDLAWQRAQLALERKRQSQRRNDYLNLSAADPQKLPQGIILMASRVSLELSDLQNKRREARSKAAKNIAQRLKDELADIHLRLQLSDKNDDVWLKEQTKAEERANALRAQVNVSVGDQLPDTPLGSANIKYLLLKAAATEIQIGTNELAAMRYQMSHALAHSELGKDKLHNVDSVSNLLGQYTQLRESVNEQEKAWRSLTSQARKYAMAQTVNQEQTDTALMQAYKSLLAQVDDNDRWLRDLNFEQDVGGFLQEVTQARLKESAGWYEGWQFDAKDWLVTGWSQLSTWLNASLFEINETPVTTMGLLSVLFIITIAWFISRIFRRGLDRLGQRKDGVSASALYSLGRVIHYIILVVGIIIGLSSIGIDFTKFALFASALGVGIGFGLQTLIGNFVAGLIILFERSLKVGDFVELSSGLVGEVKEINMRSTLVTTNDNVDILVPNSEFVNSQVTNWTLRDTQRRIHIPFGVAYGTDKDLVKKAVLEAAEVVKWTLNDKKSRQPQVWFVEFGDSSLNFELVVWLKPEAVKRPSAVQAAYLWEIETKFKEYEIEIPFPQRDLHLRSVFGQKDESGVSLFKK